MIHLTPRQAEITSALAKGETRKEIGFRLGITHSTTSVYIREARMKFGAKTTAELMVKMALAGQLAL